MRAQARGRVDNRWQGVTRWPAVVALGLGVLVWQGMAPTRIDPDEALLGQWTFQYGGMVTDAEFRADGTARIGVNEYRYTMDMNQEPWELDLISGDGVRLVGVIQVAGDGQTAELAYRSAPGERPTDVSERGMRLMRDREAAVHAAKRESRRLALFARLGR